MKLELSKAIDERVARGFRRLLWREAAMSVAAGGGGKDGQSWQRNYANWFLYEQLRHPWLSMESCS